MVAGEQRNRMSAASGKLLRNDDTELDLTALLDNVYDAVAGALKTSASGGGGTVDANLQVGDADVSGTNPVPTLPTVTAFDANLQVGDADVSETNPVPSRGVPTPFDADLYDAPAADTAAEVEIAAAGAGVCNVIRGVAWSYSAEPTAGNLKIENGATTVFSMDIATAGAGFVPVFGKGSANTALTVTLAAGGADVSGKLNVLETWTE